MQVTWSPPMRLFWLLLILAAFGLRLYRLDAQSLWYDEGVTVEVAQRGIAELTRWTAGDIQPPLYYYQMAGWGRLAGWREWSLRFPSAFWGTLTIPLMMVLATIIVRRGYLAGSLAGLIALAHPLLLYYSQEARMYALLTALGVLLGYLMIAKLSPHWRDRSLQSAWLWWLAYIAVAVAAIYTHYFAFFLLLAFGLAYLLTYLAAHPSRVQGLTIKKLLPFGVAHLLILLLYAPWIANVWRRWVVDTSYWQGAFQVGDALRHVAITFTSGETVLEQIGIWLLLPYGLVTLFAAAGLLRFPHLQPILSYSLLWLVLPVVAVLMLASLAPKFNARYVMIALPGLILLWSIGIGNLFTTIRPTSALISTLFLLTAFTYANVNWFTNPAFKKSEWRDAAGFVRLKQRQRLAAKPSTAEAVILVSGHAWPVWNYYAPDIPVLLLPEIEILDVNAVLDFPSTIEPLRFALREKTGAWLVEWQDGVVDPMGIVGLQLQQAGDEKPVDLRFWQLGLRFFKDVNPRDLILDPVALTPRSINFADRIYLVDYKEARNGDLLLFWQLHPTQVALDADLKFSATLYNKAGELIHTLTDQRLAGYRYPTFRWQPGQIQIGAIAAAGWSGHNTPNGKYMLQLSVYDAAEPDLPRLVTADGQERIELTIEKRRGSE